MLDPTILHNLTHSKVMADLLRQLTQLNPELTVEAVLPLVAARLVGADASDQGTDPLQDEDGFTGI